MNYWHECIVEAFDEAGITASDEQIKSVVEIVEGSHENYGMAHGHDCIANPLENENLRLKKELEEEIKKEVCPKCKGKGSITTGGPCHTSRSYCWVCNGQGRLIQ